MANRETLNSIRLLFEELSGLRNLQYEIKRTVDGLVLIIFISFIPKRLYSILNRAIEAETGDNLDAHAVAVLKRLSSSNLVDGPEARLLVKTLSESQNVSRHSFPEDFFERYTRSVTGAEEQIISEANHIVFGRRGAGKSMLLLYALKKLASRSRCAWIDMQLYSGREDDSAYAQVLVEILSELKTSNDSSLDWAELIRKLDEEDLSIQEVRKLLPRVKRVLSTLTVAEPVYIFLDDFHIFPQQMQNIVLDLIYSVSRGNRVFLKLSAIETMTNTYDPVKKSGLEAPQDVQILRLDNNLTTPDKTASHLEAILDSHANYAGLPGIRRLCGSADVLPRLTWVAAGVPRDAMNLFSQAMVRASSEGRKRVTVSNVNMASSETLTNKLRDLELDASDQTEKLKLLLGNIRHFCVTDKRKNAFLVEILPGVDDYNDVMELVQMRLLHIISDGITPGDAGRKYVALILDYGLYTGIRAAQSVELFNQKTEKASYRELRKLPVFTFK